MNLIMESKIRNNTPMATNYTDPKTLKFLVPPDSDKRHTFVGPNQALKSVYAISGQKPPGREHTQKATSPSGPGTGATPSPKQHRSRPIDHAPPLQQPTVLPTPTEPEIPGL